MVKKSVVTQELVNVFPPSSRTREDQSIGFGFLNTLAVPMERMNKELNRMLSNEFLPTANLDEINGIYRVALPITFEFDVDNTDPSVPTFKAPTVSGLVINDTFSGYNDITLSDTNDLRSFWYEAVPSRITLEEVKSGVSYELLSKPVNDFPHSGILNHHLGGGSIWVETTGGTQYVKSNNLGGVDRGRIILEGITRKGTNESETLIFPWDMKQKTKKEWESIERVEAFDMESGVLVEIRSADFNHGPYMSHWNLRYSDNRNKIDDFWDVKETQSGISNLQRVGYLSDEWQQLILGFSDKEPKESWTLLEYDESPIVALDTTIQPFTDRAWTVTESGSLMCFSTEEFMASGLDFLKKRTDGPYVQLDIQNTHLVSGDNLNLIPINKRPVKEIDKFRVWFEDPDGDKYGILHGEVVDFASDFYIFGNPITRTLDNELIMEVDKVGEYKFALETTYSDASVDIDRRIVQVQAKYPIVTFDTSSLIDEPLLGVDFDSDQRLWIQTATAVYRIAFHADLMLIDFENKVLYFRETYESIGVKTSG